MGATETPRYVPAWPGFEPTHPVFVQMVEPPPLSWWARHPHLGTLIVVVLAAAVVFGVRLITAGGG